MKLEGNCPFIIGVAHKNCSRPMSNGHHLAERAELAAHSEETITAAIQHSGQVM
jgi:hypothetical protein